jgi:CheY-like chemotaxis protein
VTFFLVDDLSLRRIVFAQRAVLVGNCVTASRAAAHQVCKAMIANTQKLSQNLCATPMRTESRSSATTDFEIVSNPGPQHAYAQLPSGSAPISYGHATHFSPLADAKPATQAAAHRLLIVDQEGLFSSMLGKALETAGFAVWRATNSQNALCLIDQCRPDLILLNLMTGDTEAQALCTQLRDCYDLPIVVMSKSKEAQAILNAYAAGATAVVQMPFGLQELAAQIKQAAQLYKSEHPSPAERVLQTI